MTLRDADHWLAVVGIPLSALPGNAAVSVRHAPDSAPETIHFVIVPKQYTIQKLRVKPSQVDLSKSDLARYLSEHRRLQAATGGTRYVHVRGADNIATVGPDRWHTH
jgi:hypothetical protein